MARPSTALLLVLFMLVAAAPFASAAVGLPPPAGDTERVSGFSWHTPHGGCHSWDPVLGAVGLALPSEATAQPVPGGTRYDLHLESLAAPEECPALDVSFDMPGAPWPASEAFAEVASPCGSTGRAWFYPYAEGYHVQLDLRIPAACVAGVVGSVFFSISVQPVRPSEYMACSPVDLVVTSCVGAADDREERYTCGNGQRPGTTYVTLVFYAYRDCDWEGGGDHVRIGPAVGIVWIEASESSCHIVVNDGFFGVVDERMGCPDEVHALAYGTGWGSVLP